MFQHLFWSIPFFLLCAYGLNCWGGWTNENSSCKSLEQKGKSVITCSLHLTPAFPHYSVCCLTLWWPRWKVHRTKNRKIKLEKKSVLSWRWFCCLYFCFLKVIPFLCFSNAHSRRENSFGCFWKSINFLFLSLPTHMGYIPFHHIPLFLTLLVLEGRILCFLLFFACMFCSVNIILNLLKNMAVLLTRLCSAGLIN